jgi:hypothetical protein
MNIFCYIIGIYWVMCLQFLYLGYYIYIALYDQRIDHMMCRSNGIPYKQVHQKRQENKFLSHQ